MAILSSCTQKSVNPISSISYSIENGGKGAASSSITISKDSTKYVWANYKETKTRSEATLPKTWNKIVGIINLEDFDQISSSERRIQYDGSDIVIVINDDKEHKLINGEQDSIHYSKIKPLKKMIEQEHKRLDSLALRL
ncbi:hypothetical protein NJT12_01285 [Flavobacterium sp. AC]|uniref:Lipoprotein n=1 Tax=Flavobacterium azizsancarii TaxID=2961580 RepID=A0ABT4W6N4_9FLAO|nr:hypothetical protein [Flavobacterium azizsancarii]MDA6068240.1 hypothetical protein [Flavobacterium azizsancarii]